MSLTHCQLPSSPQAPLKAFAPLLDQATKAMALWKLAQSWRPIPRKALPVVLQPAVEVAKVAFNRSGYYYSDPAAVNVPFKVNNLILNAGVRVA